MRTKSLNKKPALSRSLSVSSIIFQELSHFALVIPPSEHSVPFFFFLVSYDYEFAFKFDREKKSLGIKRERGGESFKHIAKF